MIKTKVISRKAAKPAVKHKLVARTPLSKKGTRISLVKKKAANAKVAQAPFNPTLQPLVPPTPAQPKVEEAKVKEPAPPTPGPTLNSPLTQEQQNGIPSVISGDNPIEGVRHIAHLPLEQQMNQVFNPLHGLTKTAVKDGITDSTYIVPSEKVN
jgi:hypothetical protein